MNFIIACSMLVVALWGADAMSQSKVMECLMTAMSPDVQQHCQQELTSNPAFIEFMESGKPLCAIMPKATELSHSCIAAKIKSTPGCNDPAVDKGLEKGRALAMKTAESTGCKGENSVKRSVDDLDAAHIAKIAVNTVATNI